MTKQEGRFGRVSVLARLKNCLYVCCGLCLAIPVLAVLIIAYACYKSYGRLKLAVVGRKCERCGRTRAVFRTGRARKVPNIKFNVDNEVWEFRCRFCGLTFEEKQDLL
jgi:hypothetical protein